MIIDVHTHYGYSFFPIETMFHEGIVEMMDIYNIDIGITSGFRGIFYELDNCNEEVYQGILKSNGRLKGYVVVNPNHIDKSLSDIETYMAYDEFVGVKIHPAWHGVPIDDARFHPIIDLCTDKGIPLLVHSFVSEYTGPQVSEPERITKVAKRNKKCVIVMGHIGGNTRRGVNAAKGIDNIFVEICGGRQDADSTSVWTSDRLSLPIKELGSERVLFGTDLPLIDPSSSIGILEESNFASLEKENVMYRNAKKLFSI